MLLVTHDIEDAVYLAHRVVVMAGRPGAIKQVIPIALPRPRDRVSAELTALRRQVHAALFHPLESV